MYIENKETQEAGAFRSSIVGRALAHGKMAERVSEAGARRGSQGLAGLGSTLVQAVWRTGGESRDIGMAVKAKPAGEDALAAMANDDDKRRTTTQYPA